MFIAMKFQFNANAVEYTHITTRATALHVSLKRYKTKRMGFSTF
jgi:hypothetical protein